VITKGTFVDGFNMFLLPDGLYSQNSMILFILALVIPGLVTIVISLVLPPKPFPTATPKANTVDDIEYAAVKSPGA